MNCRKCGTPLADDEAVHFCSFCGEPVNPIEKRRRLPGIKVTEDHVTVHRDGVTLFQLPREQVERALRAAGVAAYGYATKKLDDQSSQPPPSKPRRRLLRGKRSDGDQV
jgi:hypothetical protein